MRFFVTAALVLACSLAPAYSADVADFVTACTHSSNLDESMCNCVGENAKTDLGPEGFDYLVATLAKDKSTADALRPKLGMERLMKASLYMTKGPAKCAAAAAPKE